MGRKRKKVALLSTLTAICLLRQARRRKSRSCWVRSWLLRRDENGFSNTLVRELESDDLAEYKSMFRMDKDSFQFLLEKVTPLIRKEDTLLRQSVSPVQRLQVTLRYLASGKTILLSRC